MDRKFTNDAQRAMELAEVLARRTHSEHVTTWHMILALIEDENSLISKILEKLGADRVAVQDMLLRLSLPGCAIISMSTLPFVPRVENAIDFARKKSAEWNDSDIGVEHIFLGLLMEYESPGVRALAGWNNITVTGAEVAIRDLRMENSTVDTVSEIPANLALSAVSSVEEDTD